MGPRGVAEVVFGAFGNLIGAIATANLFGELAVLVIDLNLKSTMYQKKVDTANGAMQNMRLTPEFQNKCLSYLRSTQESQNQ